MYRPAMQRLIAGGRTGRRRSAVLAITTVGAIALTGCVANPPSAVENPAETKPAAAERTSNTVTVAMDGIGRGFNPHLLADQSATTAAVASLVLPSAFRYEPAPVDPAAPPAPPAATLQMDTSVLESADVVSEEPFTVEYQLQNAAQWSDGAPIAVEDFRYLWQRMISEPGVVDRAGYDLISDVVASGEGGKTVKVVFTSPYPAWRELFENMLPAHLVKDSLGGFSNALKDKIAVSGGRFKVTTIDRGRNEILLDRNDRFWGDVATPDRIVFRRGAGSGAVASSLRAGDTQIASMHGGSATQAQLSTIPGVQVTRELQPRVLSLTLNSRNSELADAQVRKGLLGLLDADQLAVIGAQTESSVTMARSQLLAPSEPGYAPTAPPPLGAEQAQRLLASAGYKVGVAEGKPLSLVIAVPSGDEMGIAVANAAADTWRSAGVDVTVSASTDSDKLYGESLLDGSIGVVVGWRVVGGDIGTEIASRFSCEDAPAAAGQSPNATPTSAPSASASASATAAPAESVPQPPSNIGGVCDPAAQEQIDAALSGQQPAVDVAHQLDPRMWDLATTLPILQDTEVVAIGPTVSGAVVRTPISAGLFVDVGSWSRVPQ